VTEKKADDDEQSKPLNLTPKIRICSGLFIQCHQWESGQKFLTIYRKKVAHLSNDSWLYFLTQISVVCFCVVASYSCAARSIHICVRNRCADSPIASGGTNTSRLTKIGIISGSHAFHINEYLIFLH
jgi:hypothetical protein